MSSVVLLALLLGFIGLSHEQLRPADCRSDVNEAKLCKDWYYSGKGCQRVPDKECSVTRNGFTNEECRAACGKERPERDRGPACSVKMKSSPCKRRYYNKETNKCEALDRNSKMCLQGRNAWMMEDTFCKDNCVRSAKCFAEPVLRPCEQFYARMKGSSFHKCSVYGKWECSLKTKNSFTSKKECQNMCDVETPPEDCFGPVQSKRCNYFYFGNGQCLQTPSKQCAFGSNAFQSKSDCYPCVE